MPRFSDVGCTTGPLPPEARLAVKPAHGQVQVVHLEDLYELIRCLAAGHVVHAIVARFPSWNTDTVAASGMVPYPELGEEPDSLVPVRLFGYDTSKCRVTFESETLPPAWGDQGCGYLLFGYVERYTSAMIAHLPLLT